MTVPIHVGRHVRTIQTKMQWLLKSKPIVILQEKIVSTILKTHSLCLADGLGQNMYFESNENRFFFSFGLNFRLRFYRPIPLEFRFESLISTTSELRFLHRGTVVAKAVLLRINFIKVLNMQLRKRQYNALQMNWRRVFHFCNCSSDLCIPKAESRNLITKHNWTPNSVLNSIQVGWSNNNACENNSNKCIKITWTQLEENSNWSE